MNSVSFKYSRAIYYGLCLNLHLLPYMTCEKSEGSVVERGWFKHTCSTLYIHIQYDRKGRVCKLFIKIPFLNMLYFILIFFSEIQVERQLDPDAIFLLRRRFMMVCNRVRQSIASFL